MNSLHFCQMLSNSWAADEEAQGEYCQLAQDLVTIYDQECQELTNSYPVVQEVKGAIAVVEVFKDVTDIWFVTLKEPEQGTAIFISHLGIYALKPLEVR